MCDVNFYVVKKEKKKVVVDDVTGTICDQLFDSIVEWSHFGWECCGIPTSRNCRCYHLWRNVLTYTPEHKEQIDVTKHEQTNLQHTLETTKETKSSGDITNTSNTLSNRTQKGSLDTLYNLVDSGTDIMKSVSIRAKTTPQPIYPQV